MPDKVNIVIAAVILLYCAVLVLGFAVPHHAGASSSIDYMLLKKSGVKILIREYDIKSDNTFEFDLYREDVSIKDYVWSLIWGKNFGFYMDGVNPNNKDIKCPYVGEDEKRPGSDIKDIGNGKHHVTLVLPPPLIDAIIKNRCAVSPKPRKAPDTDSKKKEGSSQTVFPAIYK